MKKILVAISRQQGGSYNESMIKKYLEDVQSRGYIVEMMDDHSGDVYRFLEEMPLLGDLTPYQQELLQHIGDYEHIVYVPARAMNLKDALVYRASSIANQPMDSREKEQTSAAQSQQIHHPLDETALVNETAASDLVGEVYQIESVECNNVASQDENTAAICAVLEGQVELDLGENSNESTEIALEQKRSEQVELSQEELVQENLEQTSNDAASYFSSDDTRMVQPLSSENTSAEDAMGFAVSSDEIEEDIQIPLVENRESIRASVERISMEEILSMGEAAEQGLLPLITEEKPKKMSAARRVRLLFPWIVMAIMAALGYEKTTWLPFILATFALLITGVSKKYKNLDKTAEWLSVLMAIVALVVGIAYTKWMTAISLPIAMMAIILFVVVGFVDWDN